MAILCGGGDGGGASSTVGEMDREFEELSADRENMRSTRRRAGGGEPSSIVLCIAVWLSTTSGPSRERKMAGGIW
jgi:hypothetical protein